MENLLLLVNNAINLDSYRASPTWIGFFESNNTFDRRKAVELAIEEMRALLEDSYAFGACHFFGTLKKFQTDYEVEQLDVDNIIVPLINADIVRIYKHYKQCEKVRELPLVDFSTKHKLCLAIMEIGVKGHLFFLNKKTNLIIYPHEDVGFGFIGASLDSIKCGENILGSLLEKDCWKGRVRKAEDMDS